MESGKGLSILCCGAGKGRRMQSRSSHGARDRAPAVRAHKKKPPAHEADADASSSDSDADSSAHKAADADADADADASSATGLLRVSAASPKRGRLRPRGLTGARGPASKRRSAPGLLRGLRAALVESDATAAAGAENNDLSDLWHSTDRGESGERDGHEVGLRGDWGHADVDEDAESDAEAEAEATVRRQVGAEEVRQRQQYPTPTKQLAAMYCRASAAGDASELERSGEDEAEAEAEADATLMTTGVTFCGAPAVAVPSASNAVSEPEAPWGTPFVPSANSTALVVAEPAEPHVALSPSDDAVALGGPEKRHKRKHKHKHREHQNAPIEVGSPNAQSGEDAAAAAAPDSLTPIFGGILMSLMHANLTTCYP